MVLGHWMSGVLGLELLNDCIRKCKFNKPTAGKPEGAARAKLESGDPSSGPMATEGGGRDHLEEKRGRGGRARLGSQR